MKALMANIEAVVFRQVAQKWGLIWKNMETDALI